MSFKRLDTIADYDRHGFDLRATCLCCERVVVLDSLLLTRALSFGKRSRDMGAVERRLRCAECGGDQVKCGPVERKH